MKRIIVLFLFLFVFVSFSSAEVMLALGWRLSDSGLVLGEYALPCSLSRVIEYFDPVYGTFRQTKTTRYTTDGNINLFQRRAYLVFGIDWFVYKKQLSLGFEVNAGFLKRRHSARITEKLEINEQLIYEETREEKDTTTIIPANLFLLLKYKFSSTRIRAHLGIGGGLNSTIFLNGITEFDENSTETGEKTFTYSGTLVGLAGIELFFSGKTAIFLELRYFKPITQGKNFRDQIVLGTGFRFL